MIVKYTYPTVIQSIANIRGDLKLFAGQSGLPTSELRQVTLVIEELFSKIIRFAFQNMEDEDLDITLSKLEGELLIKIEYSGKLYNPVKTDPKELSDPAFIEEGGMGLSLIKAFCDSIEYKSENQLNTLLIKKVIRGQTENQQT